MRIINSMHKELSWINEKVVTVQIATKLQRTGMAFIPLSEKPARHREFRRGERVLVP